LRPHGFCGRRRRDSAHLHQPGLSGLAGEATWQANAAACAAKELTPVDDRLADTLPRFSFTRRDGAPGSQITWMQWAVFAGMGLVVALLLWQLCRYISFVAEVLPLPFGIDYGEGIVMQQAMLIPGPGMYGDIDLYPYIVFHYPPFYHLVVHAISALGFDMLQVGRWVSVLATVATAALIAGLVFRSVRATAPWATGLVGAAIGGLTVFTYLPVVEWSPVMRVDMLAVALSFAGVYLAMLATRRPLLLYAASLAFVLAIYTKQTMVAAPVATFGVLWLREPRSVVRPIGFGITLSLAALAWLTWQTDGGFLRHILLYNINRFSVLALLRWSGQVSRFGVYLAVVVIFGLIEGWRRLRATPDGQPATSIRQQIRESDSALVLVVFTAWFAASAAMLVTLGKTGGSQNYFIEWMCVWSVIIGITVGNALHAVVVGGRAGMAAARVCELALIPALLILQLLYIRMPDPTVLTSASTRHEMDQLARMIQAAPKPVLSDDMVLLLRAGKEVPLEPAIFAELATVGRRDQTKLLDLINSHAFAFIVSQGGPGVGLYDERYTKPVQAAIAANYPRLERLATYVVMQP
jgi:hypothetical protein